MIALLLTLFLSFPLIVVSNDGEKFFIEYDRGAIWACTVYELQNVDPPYAPRHCWGLNKNSHYYGDDWAYILKYDGDWLVWAEVGYPKGGEIEYIETNKVRVYRQLWATLYPLHRILEPGGLAKLYMAYVKSAKKSSE